MRTLRFGLLLACMAVLFASCGLTSQSTGSSNKTTNSKVTVNVHDNYFDPKNINVAPEKQASVTFINKGSSVHIVEILGLTSETTLQPGGTVTFKITPQKRSYKMYDELYVSQGMVGAFSGLQATTDAKATPAPVPSISTSISAYRDYVKGQTEKIQTETQAFVDAINAGNLAKAQDLYGTARVGYERIEPIAEKLGDLDPKLDAREGDVPTNEWTGYHRIEKTLWIDKTTKGLDKYTTQLLSDVKTLNTSVDTVKLSSTGIIDGAVGLLNEASHSKISGEEDRYSHTDLYDLASNVEGSQAAFIVFKDFLTKNNPALYQDIQTKFENIEKVLKPFRTSDGFVAYSALTDTNKKDIANAINTVGEALSKVAVNLPQGS